MGFLSKLWKGVKKTVKKIGKGIKSAFMKVGKFMNKIGIVGQIALGLILPGVGEILGAWAGTASTNIFAAGAKAFVNGAIQIGTKVGSVFKTVTQGVTKVIGQTVGTVLNKAGLTDVVGKFGIDIKNMTNFTGEGGVFETAGKVLSDTVNAGKDLFSMDTLVGKNKFAVEAALKSGAVKDMGVSSGKIGATPDAEFTKPSGAVDVDASKFKIVDGKVVSSTTGVEPLKNEFVPSQPSSLLAGSSTNAVTTDVGPLKEGYEFLKEEGKQQITGFADKVTSGAAAKLTGTGPKAAEITSYNSNITPLEPVDIGGDSALQIPQTYQDAMQGILGFFGNPAALYNQQQNELAKSQVQAQGGF
tara:strand:+ start:329 stop:1402 length:1074 start_codon:yes stop_codon:yes gene_type:complete